MEIEEYNNLLNNCIKYAEYFYKKLVPYTCTVDVPNGYRFIYYEHIPRNIASASKMVTRDNKPILGYLGMGNVVCINIGQLMSYCSGDLSKTLVMLLITMAHELSHIDQFIDYQKYGKDEEYTKKIEYANISNTASLLANFGDRIIADTPIEKDDFYARCSYDAAIYPYCIDSYKEKTLKQAIFTKLTMLGFGFGKTKVHNALNSGRKVVLRVWSRDTASIYDIPIYKVLSTTYGTDNIIMMQLNNLLDFVYNSYHVDAHDCYWELAFID